MGRLNGTNPNRPQKGSRITVDPIRNEKDIKRIKRLLKKNPRDLLLFAIGINNGLRISDILKLKVKDLKGLEVGETLKIKEQKTGKINILMMNRYVLEVLKNYLSKIHTDENDYLFKSRNGKNKPITKETAHKMVKIWTKSIRGNFGTHSLRKTFGYRHRIKWGTSFELLCKRFGHSSPSITMRYLGIEDKEVNGILLNEI
jgi:integrase